jgi:class 3 adenylate cyclase
MESEKPPKSSIIMARDFLGFVILWALMSAGFEYVAVNVIMIKDESQTLGKLAALVLLIWWFLVSWRQKVGQLLALQEFLREKNMLPYHVKMFRGSMPWNLGHKRRELLGSVATQFFTMSQKVEDSNKTLERFVGTNVSTNAVNRAQRNELGGELRRVYVLFSDVRGFTQMAEKLKPEETVDVLNRMFAAMEEVLAQAGGDINKYVGDAIFAYFRRPYGDEGDAVQKVLRAGLRMQDRFEGLNARYRVSYSQPVEIGLGIGITAGEAIVGNLGSPNRMEFTLIGDTVNMASRLCSIAKHGQILVNEDLAKAAEHIFEMVAMPPVEIKGKSGFHTPYAIVGEKLTLSR